MSRSIRAALLLLACCAGARAETLPQEEPAQGPAVPREAAPDAPTLIERTPSEPATPPPSAQPASWPAIVAIRFEGNDTTQEKVMRRELLITEGDPADPQKLERSRQYVLDLGLFSRVRVRQEPAEGGTIVTFVVDERWYILPYPRFAVNVEGQSSVGLDLRWANVFGLNHNLRFNVLETDRKIEGRGKELSYSAGYSAPFAFDSPYRVSFSAGHTRSPAQEPVAHIEYFDNASVFVSRTFQDPGGARSQGNTVGLGLAWQREDREGEGVPPPYGQATALTGSWSYRNLRFRTYSEEGHSWRVGGSFARDGLASDYSYQSLEAEYERYWLIGTTPHQNLIATVAAGTFSNAPREINVYSFGGSSVLRGYSANSLTGNTYYLGTLEFFRPVFDPGLRLGLIFEAGKLFASSRDADLHSIDASLGIGLRLRLVRFVALEIELGYAIPLKEGGRAKLFGGRV